MKVLAIATHPDDETLGCGGTLLRHMADGDSVHWLIVTEAKPNDFGHDFAAARPALIGKVADAYGFAGISELRFPAARLAEVAEKDLIQGFAQAIASVAPDVVYLNHGGDAHSDHRRAFAAAMAALKPFRSGKSVHRILAYETLSETEQAPAGFGPHFVLNAFVDITPFLERKIALFDLYETERQPFPLPREASAIRALARLRGATIGVDSAEAFMLMREVR